MALPDDRTPYRPNGARATRRHTTLIVVAAVLAGALGLTLHLVGVDGHLTRSRSGLVDLADLRAVHSLRRPGHHQRTHGNFFEIRCRTKVEMPGLQRSRQALVHPEPGEFDVLDILHALSDPTRMTIVQTLRAAPEHACGRFPVDVAPSTLTRRRGAFGPGRRPPLRRHQRRLTPSCAVTPALFGPARALRRRPISRAG